MKLFTLIISLLIFTNIYSQVKTDKTNIFVRVYDLQNKKTHKGRVISVSDSILQLKIKKKIIDIPIEFIGRIKTKHSTGNALLIGASTGLGLGIILSTASGQGESIVEGYSGIGSALLVTTGATIGGISAIIKNSVSFQIHGKSDNLLAFKEMFDDQKKKHSK